MNRGKRKAVAIVTKQAVMPLPATLGEGGEILLQTNKQRLEGAEGVQLMKEDKSEGETQKDEVQEEKEEEDETAKKKKKKKRMEMEAKEMEQDGEEGRQAVENEKHVEKEEAGVELGRVGGGVLAVQEKEQKQSQDEKTKGNEGMERMEKHEEGVGLGEAHGEMLVSAAAATPAGVTGAGEIIGPVGGEVLSLSGDKGKEEEGGQKSHQIVNVKAMEVGGFDGVGGGAGGDGGEGGFRGLERYPPLDDSTVMFLHVFKCAGYTLRYARMHVYAVYRDILR